MCAVIVFLFLRWWYDGFDFVAVLVDCGYYLMWSCPSHAELMAVHRFGYKDEVTHVNAGYPNARLGIASPSSLLRLDRFRP